MNTVNSTSVRGAERSAERAANRIRLIIFAVVALLHGALLLFFVIHIDAAATVLKEPPPTMMKLTDILEDRLASLEKDYSRFEYLLNPYHIEPGLLLDVDITSIKRKKATLDAMANVLNEFLHGVSKGFQDAAFASFSRRRSTVREDINQSFSDIGGSPASSAAAPAQAYLDLLNADDGIADTGAENIGIADEPVPVKASNAKALSAKASAAKKAPPKQKK